MSKVSEILVGKGIGTSGIRTDENSIRAAIIELKLLSAAFEITATIGKEVCNNGEVVVCNNEIVFNNSANVEIIVIPL